MIRAVVILCCVAATIADVPVPPRPTLQANVTRPGSGKIINGIDANPGQIPYIVSLKYDSTNSHSCGGSILTPGWVLTAAHCCLTGSKEHIYTSSIYLSQGGLNFEIAELITHPEYDASNYWHNDICLVRINGKIPLDANAQQVSLAAEGTQVPDKAPVIIAGWGYTTSSYPQNIPDRLQVVTKLVARIPEYCQSSTGVPQFDGHICTEGSDGQAVCNGDSGGPLTYNGGQVGITSFGFVPCGSGHPDFFTRVPQYISWIKQTLGADAASLKIVNV